MKHTLQEFKKWLKTLPKGYLFNLPDSAGVCSYCPLARFLQRNGDCVTYAYGSATINGKEHNRILNAKWARNVEDYFDNHSYKATKEQLLEAATQ